MFDEIEKFANGEIKADRLQTMAKASDTILKTVALDVKARQMMMIETNGRGGAKAMKRLNLNLSLTSKEAGEGDVFRDEIELPGVISIMRENNILFKTAHGHTVELGHGEYGLIAGEVAPGETVTLCIPRSIYNNALTKQS